MFKMNGRLQQIEEWTDYDEIVVSSLVLSNKLLKAIIEMVTPGRGRRFEMPKEKENIKMLQKCAGIDEVIESLKDARNVPAEARNAPDGNRIVEQISIYCHWASTIPISSQTARKLNGPFPLQRSFTKGRFVHSAKFMRAFTDNEGRYRIMSKEINDLIELSYKVSLISNTEDLANAFVEWIALCKEDVDPILKFVRRLSK